MYVTEWLKLKIVTIPNAGDDVEKPDHTSMAGGNVKRYSHFGKQSGGFLQN